MFTAAILGGHGFLGHHLARRLQREGFYVRTVDIAEYKYGAIDFTDDYVISDLRSWENAANAIMIDGYPATQVWALAAWMGGAGVIFSQDYDAQILHDNLRINVNIADVCSKFKVEKVLFTSSACCYNADIQQDTNNTGLKESDDYPANPDSDYGFEKLQAERIYTAYHKNNRLDIRIARLHNVFGTEGSWNNGKEKAPAALCRKIAEAKDGGEIEIWGDGNQTRSFIYVDEAVEGIRRLMEHPFYHKPLNVGSDEMVTINQLAEMIMQIAGKKLTIKYLLDKPQGVRGRNSNNELIFKTLNWNPSAKLETGIEVLYNWINQQVNG